VTVVHEKKEYIHVEQHVEPRQRGKYKVRMGLWEAEKNRED
jgi:hypothetical protein